MFVHHVGRASIAKADQHRCRRLLAADTKTYEDKWGVKWRTAHRAPRFAERSRRGAKSSRLRAAAASGGLTAPAKVSVVIINYNGREHFDPCLQSLAKTEKPPGGIEIVVVDNGSTDGSVTFLKNNYPQVKIYEAGSNLGFSKAANLGAAKATGEFVVFLNNDVRVASDWLTHLLAAFTLDPQVGAACSLILKWDGTDVDFAGRPDDALNMRYELAETVLKPSYATDCYLFFLSGGSLAVPATSFSTWAALIRVSSCTTRTSI